VEACQQFVQPAQWAACGNPVGDLTRCAEVYGGLDLSEANDLTALVLIGKIDNVWHVRPWFWLPDDHLFERSRGDRVHYDKWAQQGFLETIPGAAITYDKVVPRLLEILSEHKIQKVAFDRWNFKHLKPWLLHNGVSEQTIVDQWVEFGQGTVSMSPALRELESRILQCQLAHGQHPILNMCMANAVVEGSKDGAKKDSANRKLSKKRSAGRIDGAIALTMAIGVSPVAAMKIDVAALIG
jgi:phage terminase large subunit-like protein